MRHSLHLCVLIWFMLVISSLSAMALGGLQSLHPAIIELLDGCAGQSRCWHGITTGRSTLEDADRWWGGQGYSIRYDTDVTLQQQVQASSEQHAACRLYATAPINQTQMVQDILAFYCEQTPQLGDVILALGPPDVQIRCSRLGSAFLRLPGNTQLNLWWGIGDHWTPFVRIDSLLFNVPQRAGNAGRHEWRGFAPAWRYCAEEL